MSEELVEKIRYEADISQLTTALRTIGDKQSALEKDTATRTGMMSKSWGNLKSTLATGGAWFAGIGGAAAVAIPKILDQGGQLDALDKKAQTVFGGNALKGVQAWATGVAGSMGLTTSQAVGMATSMGDLFKPMGFTADQAAAMSTQLGNMSGALSAWSGGKQSAAEVSETITKAMLGERDGLKELGISISEADVQAQLAKDGQAGLTGAALEQAKALATQKLIMAKSTDAQKAWADGSMDGIKSQNESKASMKQLGETVVRLVYPVLQKIVPVIQKVAEWLGEHLPGAIRTVAGPLGAIAGFFGNNKDLLLAVASAVGVLVAAFVGMMVISKLQTMVATFNAVLAANPIILTVVAIAALVAGLVYAYQKVGWFRDLVQKAFAIVKVAVEVVGTAFAVAAKWIGEKVATIVGFVTGIPGKISSTVSGLWEGIKTGITIAKDWVVDKIAAIVGIVQSIPSRIAKFAGGLFDGLKNAAKAAFNWIAGVWNNTFGKLSFHIPSWVPGIGGAGFDVPDIPTFHSGGITNFGAAGQGLALLRNNEAVIPLDNQRDASRVAGRAGLGGVTIQNMTVVTNDSPRRFFDEGLWRVA